MQQQSERTEISESAYEYLLGELLALSVPQTECDKHALLTKRLESIGYDVGYRYIEKISPPQKNLGAEPLDLIKFICKEFWEEIFKKKVR